MQVEPVTEKLETAESRAEALYFEAQRTKLLEAMADARRNTEELAKISSDALKHASDSAVLDVILKKLKSADTSRSRVSSSASAGGKSSRNGASPATPVAAENSPRSKQSKGSVAAEEGEKAESSGKSTEIQTAEDSSLVVSSPLKEEKSGTVTEDIPLESDIRTVEGTKISMKCICNVRFIYFFDLMHTNTREFQ